MKKLHLIGTLLSLILLSSYPSAQVVIIPRSGSIATPVSVANGGTGNASYTAGVTLCASATTTIVGVDPSTSGFVYTSNGAGSCPSFQALPSSGASTTLNNLGTTAINAALLFGSDNVVDIGALAASRPRTGYFGTSVLAPLFNAATGFQIAGAATSRKLLVGNGTNYVASTETWAVPGTSGNYLKSDGTNWTSATPAFADTALSNITTITHSLLFTDNTYDIGASGATRPRTGYFGTSLIAATSLNVGATLNPFGYSSVINLTSSSSPLIVFHGTNASDRDYAIRLSGVGFGDLTFYQGSTNQSDPTSGSVRLRLLQDSGLVIGGSAPTVSNTTANSCGTTAATIAGNSFSGEITVGATAGTSCTITFPTAAPNRWDCTANDETTTANLISAVYLTTTTVKIVGTMGAGDVVNYICAAR